jgi:hypothetical protein
LHSTNKDHLCNLICNATFFVDDCQIRMQSIGELLCAFHAACIGRDDHTLAISKALVDVLGKQMLSVEIVHRNVEETLDLIRTANSKNGSQNEYEIEWTK